MDTSCEEPYLVSRFVRSDPSALRSSTLKQHSLSDGILDSLANSGLEIPTRVAKGAKVGEVFRRKALALMLRANSCICSISAGRCWSLFNDTSSSCRFFRSLI